MTKQNDDDKSRNDDRGDGSTCHYGTAEDVSDAVMWPTGKNPYPDPLKNKPEPPEQAPAPPVKES